MSHFIHPLLNSNGNKPSYIYIQNTGGAVHGQADRHHYEQQLPVDDPRAGLGGRLGEGQGAAPPKGPVPVAAETTTTLDEITVTVTEPGPLRA